MGCKPCDGVSRISVQVFPRNRDLASNLDIALPGFAERTPPPDWNQNRVFAYVLTTIKIDGKSFVQTGSAPNFQGGLITLCTCMRYHRTWWKTWKGTWVAGFCGKNWPGGNQLFYLMQVAEDYDSQFDLWNDLSTTARNAKSATRNRFGDVYEPNTTTPATRYDPDTYLRPIDKSPENSHVHLRKEDWKQDICYRYPQLDHKMPKLLVGDPDRSFLWRRPKYSYIGRQHPRNKVYSSLAEFYRKLK